MKFTITIFSLFLGILLSLFSAETTLGSTIQWTDRASMPTARAHLRATTANNGKIYVIGGHNINGVNLATVEEYDPSTNAWTSKSSMSTARNGLAIIATPNGKIYAIGGYSGGYVATVEEYDITSNTWANKTAMPEARGYSGYGFGPNGKIYIIGGSNSFGSDTNTVFEYDPDTDTWATKSPMPTSRTALTAAVVNGKIYAIGGNGATAAGYNNEEYDPLTDSWTIEANMPTARVYLGAVAVNNEKIYALGGLNWPPTGILYSSTVEEYNPATNTWVTATSLQTARLGLGVTLANSKIYAIGGQNQSGVLSTNEEATVIFPNNPPSANSIPNASINEGDTYSANGSFTDPDSTIWTATVDYGDGSGTQPLTLSGTNFSLNHIYKGNGIYIVTVSVTDNQGATGTGTATITVNNVLPTVGAITAPTSPVQVNTAVTASAPFTDPGVLDTHTTVWNWGDGTTTSGTVTETNGSGTVSHSHTYTSAGVYTITLTVTDKDGGQGSSIFQYVVVYDPSAGYVTGGGTITSPTGAYTPDPTLSGKAMFGFVSKYQNGANLPTGSTQFRFVVADFAFKSTSYDWLVVGGARAQYKGSGTINGSGDYGFILSAIDGQINGGGGVDKFRIKIIDKTTGNVIYDNQIGASDTSDPATAIDSGSITIHN